MIECAIFTGYVNSWRYLDCCAEHRTKMLQRYVSKIIKNSLSSRHYASVCYKGTSRHCNDTGNTIQHHMCELEQRFAEGNMLEAVCDIKFLIAKAIGLKTVSINVNFISSLGSIVICPQSCKTFNPLKYSMV